MEIVGSIPKDQRKLFNYELNWQKIATDKANILESKIRPWLYK